MTSKERLEELIALNSLGLIEGEELDELESFRRTSTEEIEKRINEFDEVANSLLFAADEIAPPEELRKRLLTRINPTHIEVSENREKVSFWKRIQPFLYGLGTAAAATAIFVFIAGQSLNSRISSLNQQIAALQTQKEQQAEKISSLESSLLSKNELIARMEQTLDRKEELVGYIENPNVIVIDLGNLKQEINSIGRVMWNKSEDSAIFCGINLPQTTPDKTYQLWAIIDSKPKSYGIFNVDEEGNGIIKLNYQDSYESIQQFAVTLEPAGGMPQPTGEMYLAGNAAKL